MEKFEYSASKGVTGSCPLKVFPLVFVKGVRHRTCKALRLRVKKVEDSS